MHSSPSDGLARIGLPPWTRQKTNDEPHQKSFTTMRKVSPEGCGDKGMKTGCAHSPNPSSSRQSTWSRTVRAAGRIPAARRATRCTPSGASSGATSCGCRIFGGGLGGNGAGRVFDERGVRGSERWSEYPIKNFVFSAMNPSATTHRKVISPSSGLGASFSASARGVSGCSSTLRAQSMIAETAYLSEPRPARLCETSRRLEPGIFEHLPVWCA